MRRFALLVLAALLAVPAWPRDKKKKSDEETQTLQLPKELPAAVDAETSRLVFWVSPLSARGLLSQQIRDALKALLHGAGSASIVKMRAFVAGSGDLRRVHDLVSDTFTERHMALPALSLVQVGALPLEGAQVQMEAWAVARKPANPGGLAFISGQGAESPGPLDPVAPLAQKALGQLAAAVRNAGAQPDGVLRVTCFLSSLDGWEKVRDAVLTAYPRAAADFVQLQRAPLHARAACEAVARLDAPPTPPVRLLQPDAGASQAALVNAPWLVLTGTQAAFGTQESDARLAFQRLSAQLEQAGSSPKNVVFSGLYPLSVGMAELVRKVRFEFFDPARPPAATLLPFEGLPSMDAAFAVDAVAVKAR